MNEILIDEKKYISSKRASEITGYAKDYIGQLCREGRVQARLVGRSWYVLEAAIHDHRFNKQKVETESHQTTTTISDLQETWESPRYEASPVEIFPSHNTDEFLPNEARTLDVSKNLQDSWRAWFDDTIAREASSSEIREDAEEALNEKYEMEEGEVNIPIHTKRGFPPKELLPKQHVEIEFPMPNKKTDGFEEKQDKNGVALRTIRIFGLLLVIVSVTLAVINTGYFDDYLVSYSQAGIISGIVLYNK